MKTFADLNFPGRLVAVEGLDGSGKSTQIYLLKRWLQLQGLKVYFSDESQSSEGLGISGSGSLATCGRQRTISMLLSARLTR